MARATKVTGWPVMPAKCASCPFRQDKRGDRELASKVLNRTLFQASQICHHPALAGKKQTHLCRGQRDEQLMLLHRLGWIEAATDDAFTKRSKQLLGTTPQAF